MTAPPSGPAGAWLRSRAIELEGQIRAAPQPWATWARIELGPWHEALLVRVPDTDGHRGALDRSRDVRTRTALGQVFTPAPIAQLAAELLGQLQPVVLDPACGAGSLLLAVAELWHRRGSSPAEVLASVEGWDTDEVAAWACRAALVAWALDVQGPGDAVPGRLRVVAGVDTLAALEALPGRDYAGVIANPPFLEAKRMRDAAPGLRDRLRRDFPGLTGAFDLYMAFLYRSLELVRHDGRVAIVLPNKVLQGRYAAGLRRQLLDPEHPPALEAVADLSRVQPRPFPGTSVYPVVLSLRSATCDAPIAVRRFDRGPEPGADAATWSRLMPADARSFGGEHPLFVPFEETWPHLKELLHHPRLGSVARVVSTCSFHRRGLREQYVTPTRPDVDHAHPYLGGPSRARQTEVAPFRVRWAGWWIRYAARELKEEHRNGLPDLHGTFLRPKVVLCQHARRVQPYADLAGTWVTKDVYPVAWPTAPGWSVELLCAVLASTVFTALYNTAYQGIVVGGETYHYLPAFLKCIPVPPLPKRVDWAERAVRRLQGGAGSVDLEAWWDLDRWVARAYGVDEAALAVLARVHLERVSAAAPVPPPLFKQRTPRSSPPS